MIPLQKIIDHLPENPGVYLFKNSGGEIVYIGKASNIKHRVGSYFQKPGGKDSKTWKMLENIMDIEFIITDTEKEALILEENLIKEHHPRYNVKLKDDKYYPSLRLSLEEEFPALSIVRRIRGNGSLYFGPYPSAKSLRETLKMIRKIFPIRTSLDTKFSQRPPFREKIDPDRYPEVVRQVRMFLEGKSKDLIKKLKIKMQEESERLNYEAAIKIRNQIADIVKVIEKQKIFSTDFLDQDVMGLDSRESGMVIYILFIRGGKLLGGKGFVFPSELPAKEILSSFMHQYYRKSKFIPTEILIPINLPDQPLMEQWLTEMREGRVRLFVPKKGKKRDLLNLAQENAEKYLFPGTETEEGRMALLEKLKEKLKLSKIPHRIEAFDISNFQGKYAVGSLVCFEEGKPSKEKYRHFKIKTITGADDYGMMEEVLTRHYQRSLSEKDLPDLVLLDGGRGQLNVAQKVFKRLQIEGVNLISLAKERVLEGPFDLRREKTKEKIFHPHFQAPFLLEKHSSLLNFLDHIRDEAHRFAIRYHKKLREAAANKSRLEEVPGVGPMRKRVLLEYFGSLEKIREAAVKELGRAPKMNQKLAQAVYDFLHNSSYY